MTVFMRSLVPESPMVLRITYFKDIKFVLRCVSAGSSVSATDFYPPWLVKKSASGLISQKNVCTAGTPRHRKCVFIWSVKG